MVNLTLSSKSCIKAMALLWAYAVLKILLTSDMLRTSGINPWLFLFLDTVTVPTYIIGWNHLVGSMGREIVSLKNLFKWSVITFASSTAPYLYAAWAGRQSHSKLIWFILILILLFILVGQFQKLWRAKPSG